MSDKHTKAVYLTDSQLDRSYDKFIVEYNARHCWYEKVRMMRRDPTFALARGILTAPIIKNSWRVEGLDKKACELIQRVLLPHRQRILKQSIFSAVDYGWQAWEVIPVKYPDSPDVHIAFKAMKHDYTKLRADSDGRFFGFANQTPDDLSERIVPISRATVCAGSDEYDNPYGSALMKNGEWVFDAANRLRYNTQYFNEKIAGSIQVVNYPVGETMTDTGMMPNHVIARNIVNNTNSIKGFTLPNSESAIVNQELNGHNLSEWKYSLVESSFSQDPFLSRDKYYDALKMRSLLLSERMGLEGTHGTKADSETQGDIALMNVEQWGENVIEWHNAPFGFVSKVLEFNGISWYPDRVRVVPLPLTDSDRVFYREIFRTMLNNNDLAAIILDLQELGSRANIKILPENIEKFINMKDKMNVDTKTVQSEV